MSRAVSPETRLLLDLRALAPVDMAFAATVDPDGGSFVLDRFDGARTGSLRGVRSAVGDGLGGRCIALRRPVYVADYVTARGISHQYDRAVSAEGLRSIVAVPVFDGDVVRAVVYAGSRRTLGFGERLVDRAVSVVRRHPTAPAPPEPPTTGVRAPGPDEIAELREIASAVDDPDLRRRLSGLLERLGAPADPPEPTSPLTPSSPLTARERDVLAEAALGHGNRAIGARLGLREQTVKSYLKAAMSKLDSHTRGEAVHRARVAGLLP